MEDVVYLIYFLGLLSTDCNALLLIAKQIRFSFVTVLLRWNGDLTETKEDGLTSIYLMHATSYVAYLIFTAILLFFTVFPAKLKTCKRYRFILLSEHILFSGTCDILLAIAQKRGDDVIPDMMISQILNIIYYALGISGIGCPIDSNWLPYVNITILSILSTAKIVFGLSVCYAIYLSFECHHCKENEGCKAPPPPCPLHPCHLLHSESHSHSYSHSHAHSHSRAHECIELKPMTSSKHNSRSKKNR
jgi:hypothetical protein